MRGPHGGCFRSTASSPEEQGDLHFLERVLHKLMLNFTWWVNRKDAGGRNVFQGGFLGLDNIGVFDRSAQLPNGGLHRPGGRDELDGDVCTEPDADCAGAGAARLRVPRHREQILRAFSAYCRGDDQMGGRAGLWDEQDEFFYDVLICPTAGCSP